MRAPKSVGGPVWVGIFSGIDLTMVGKTRRPAPEHVTQRAVESFGQSLQQQVDAIP
jgi:hypothetical protein